MERPPVSVVMPFHGDDEDARAALAALARIERSPGDELIVVDNTPDGVMARHAAAPVVCVPAGELASSYYARNAGAERASNEWLLFIDADTRPAPSLLDDYFAPAPGERVGAVAGEVVGARDQTALTARYSRSRNHVGQAGLRDHPYRPMAVTANLLVRAQALRELGGFLEGMRSSGDADFSWRLQDAGWELAYTDRAVVEHRHRETLRALVRVAARYGAGRRWLQRRHPAATFADPWRGLARCVAGVAVWTLTLRFERALFKGLDAVWILAEAAGSLAGNVAADLAPPAPGPAVLADRFPVAGDETGAVARALGAEIEARARPVRPDRAAGAGIRARYLEDDGPARRLADTAWLLARHPLRSARDRQGEGEPLHRLAPLVRRLSTRGATAVHALPGSAVVHDARRVAALLALPWSAGEHPAGDPAAGGHAPG